MPLVANKPSEAIAATTPKPPVNDDRVRVHLFGNQIRWAVGVIQRAMAEHRADTSSRPNATAAKRG